MVHTILLYVPVWYVVRISSKKLVPMLRTNEYVDDLSKDFFEKSWLENIYVTVLHCLIKLQGILDFFWGWMLHARSLSQTPPPLSFLPCLRFLVALFHLVDQTHGNATKQERRTAFQQGRNNHPSCSGVLTTHSIRCMMPISKEQSTLKILLFFFLKLQYI